MTRSDKQGMMANRSGPAALLLRPLLWLGGCFCGGVLLARYLGYWLPVLLAVLGLVLLLRAFWRARAIPAVAGGVFSRPGWLVRAGTLPVVVALGLLLAGAGGWRYQERAREIARGAEILARQLEKTPYVNCRLRLLEPPETALAHEEEGFWKAPALIEEMDGVVPAGRVAVLLYGKSSRDLLRGDELQGRMVLYAKRPPAWPGAFSYEEYLCGLGLSGRAKLLPTKAILADTPTVAGGGDDAAEKTESFLLKHQTGWSVLRWLDDLRAAGIRQTLRLLPGQSGAFVAAALYGYREDLDQETNDSFRYVGIGHILAISGMNVGMIVGLVWWICALLTHDRRKLAGVCLAVCLAYLVISGGQITAVRAGVISAIYLGGFFFSRRGDFMNSLGAAALLLVGWNPYTLFSLSFQLSFAAVIAISCLDREYKRVLPAWFPEEKTAVDEKEDRKPEAETSWRRAARWLGRSIWLLALMSLTAFAGVWGLMAWAFPQVSFSGLVINIVVIPLMTFSLAGGMLLPLADLLPGGWDMPVAWFLGLPTDLMLWIAKKGMWLPGGGVLVYQPPLWLLLGHYALAGLFLARGALPTQGGWRWGRRGAWGLLTASAVALLVYCLGPESKPVRSTVVLPGSADCVVMFDGAGGVRAVGVLARGGQDLLGYLRYRRIGHIDRLTTLPESTGDVERLAGQMPVRDMRRLAWPAESVATPVPNTSRKYQRTIGGVRVEVPEERLLLWRSGDGKLAAWALDIAPDPLPHESLFFSSWIWPDRCAEAYRNLWGAGWEAKVALFLRYRGRAIVAPPENRLCFGQGAVGDCLNREDYGVIEFYAQGKLEWELRAWNGREFLRMRINSAEAWQKPEP